MKRNLLITLIMMLVALTSGMNAVAAEKQSYYVFNGGTLYFYYDENYESRQGTVKDHYGYYSGYDKDKPYWETRKNGVVRVVFDSSFADYHPEKVQNMFGGCTNLTTIEGIEYLKTDKASSFEHMFYNCRSLQGTLNLSGWNTSKVTSLYNMFAECYKLNGVNVSGWNTSKVTDTRSMFLGCLSLTELDLNSWDMSSVTQMWGMFTECLSLQSVNVSTWNTSNVTSFKLMFYRCEALRDVDVSHWNTDKVTSMLEMFSHCMSLQTLDLSSWKTSGVTIMEGMFSNCSELTTIYCGDQWTNINAQSSDEMFMSCFNLVGGEGTIYDGQYTDATYARIDGGPDAPGYLTANYVLIDEAHFPDHHFRDYLKYESYGEDGKLTKEEINNITELDLGGQNIEDLTGIKYFTMLEKLNFNVNYVKYVDLSKNKALKVISCQRNQMSGQFMDYFVSHLPTVKSGEMTVYEPVDIDEGNEMTPAQVARANAKGWTVKIYADKLKTPQWQETEGFYRLNEQRFPDQNFRKGVQDNYAVTCTGAITQEEIDETYEMELTGLEIEDLTGVELFTELEGFYFQGNKIRHADFSKNPAASTIYIEQNQLRGVDMDDFIGSLPTRARNDGDINVYNGSDPDFAEGNEMTPEQVACAKEKGWRIHVWDETKGKNGDWSDTKGFWLIDRTTFPDPKFYSIVSDPNFPLDYFGVQWRCTGAMTYEETCEADEFGLEGKGIANAQGIKCFPELSCLLVSDNQLTSLDVSMLNNLGSLDIYLNQIKGDDMTALIESLPYRKKGDGDLYALYQSPVYEEGNEMTAAQVQLAKDRGWTVWAFSSEVDRFVEYLGWDYEDGIHGVLSSEPDEAVQYYTPTGQRVQTPQPGHVYVTKRGTRTRKVVAK
ncbi:MAG: BspA family leucine-rich repeat surface protein [Bacteroidaceae bacterium]|nr:BspA family leucine-rich repeat surface protein [Bacteroidaceae bacterium]